MGRWRATAPLFVFSTTKQKYLPLIRLTAVIGTVTPSVERHTIRDRTNCWVRTDGGTSLSRLLINTVWVESSTRGATNVTGFVASTLPSASRICTGSPRRRSGERSIGTWMYASSPLLSSIVVITEDLITRSPER